MELDFSQPGSGDQEKVVSETPQEGTVDVTSPPVPPPPSGGPTLEIPSDQATGDSVQQEIPQPPTAHEGKAVPIQPPPPPPVVQEQFPSHPPLKAKGHAGLWVVIIILIIVLGGGVYYFLMTDSGKSLIRLNSPELSPTDFGSETSSTFEPTTSTTELNTGTTAGEIPSTATATPASRDTQRKADLAKLQTALDLYRTENGSYPLANTIVQIGDASTTVYSALVPKFSATMPLDPLALDQGYWYGYRSDTGATAYLTARLEETTDPSATLEDGKYIYHVPLSSASSSQTTSTTTQSSTSSTPTTSTTTTTPTPAPTTTTITTL